MSLIKFLAAGRSVSNSGVSLPYREKKGVFLPKFGSPRNPFTKDVAANPTETAAATPQAVPVKTPTVITPVVPPPTQVRPTQPSPSKWVASLNPLAIFRSSPSRPVRAEQTELSLDTVKVVGNDLSDANVDVVPLKSRPTRRKGAPEAGQKWGEVGTGAFEATLV